MIRFFDVWHNNSVEGVADFGDVIGIAAVCASEAGDAAGCEGVPHGQKVCEVQGVVFAGDDDEVECVFRQEFDDRRCCSVLQERAKDSFAALQFFAEDSSGFGQWHGQDSSVQGGSTGWYGNVAALCSPLVRMRRCSAVRASRADLGLKPEIERLCFLGGADGHVAGEIHEL